MTATAEAIQKTIDPFTHGNEHVAQGGQTETSSLFIDVRTPSEFEEAHIPESRNIPLADIHKFLPELREAAKGQTLVLLCRTHNRVQIARDHLVKNGITNCRVLEGGITKWIADGKAIIRGRKGYSLERQTRLIAGLLVMIGVGLGVTLSPWFLLLPAAAGAGLFHAGLTDSCLMGILLGKLPFNRHKTV
ncbi:MAG: rhodanese-like domain-containing protein [Nitrospirota bacterium]|nr:MAG: rhodanese-like domain-containing protein [Nitrospirota bacterium]